MSDTTQHNNNGRGSYEHQDMTPRNVVYFLLVLGIATVFCVFLLRGVFVLLDRMTKASQPPVNPLVTKVPTDTRHLPQEYKGDYGKYLKENFPTPQLEIDEINQLNGVLTAEQDRLYTYGWIDQKAGTLHIPIDRAMDLLVQRGLPVGSEGKPMSNARNNATGSMGENQAAKRR